MLDTKRQSNLSEQNNNVSFFQVQLILRLGLIIKHDLTILHIWEGHTEHTFEKS